MKQFIMWAVFEHHSIAFAVSVALLIILIVNNSITVFQHDDHHRHQSEVFTTAQSVVKSFL